MNVNEFIRDETQPIFLASKPVSLRNQILFTKPKKKDDFIIAPEANATDEQGAAENIEEIAQQITEIPEN